MKKNSWHYKLLSFFELVSWGLENGESYSLCRYRLDVTFALFLALISVISIMSALFFVATYIWYVSGAEYIDVAWPIGGAVIITVLSSVFIHIKWGRKLKKIEDDFFGRGAKESKEPGLIRLRLQAWNDKICPMIRMDDE